MKFHELYNTVHLDMCEIKSSFRRLEHCKIQIENGGLERDFRGEDGFLVWIYSTISNLTFTRSYDNQSIINQINQNK